ncbi:MAG: cyclic nucleotide-binding domain-containing protein, partial [Candidatus Omnitrophica bacterium]|nr:cyclic nucleotide-binding domain-containing protein [Candidatus Omnitrophota bacterium]
MDREYQNYLHSVSIFADLNDEEIAKIAEICEEREALRDDVLFVEHTEGDELFIILEGEVTIQLELTSEEDAMPLITLQKGDVFGELSVVDDAPRSATARCLTDCHLLVLKRDDFDRVMES